MLRAIVAASALLLASTPAMAQPAGESGADPGQPAGTPPDMRAQFGHIRQACAADLSTYCGSVGSERGARRQCMVANEAKFSQGCRDAMDQMRAWRQAHPGAWRQPKG